MKCKICNSKDIIHFLNLGKQPLANKYPKNLYEIKKSNEITLNIHCPMGMKSLGRGESAIALSIISQLQSLFFGQKN